MATSFDIQFVLVDKVFLSAPCVKSLVIYNTTTLNIVKYYSFSNDTSYEKVYNYNIIIPTYI